ncbi:MarR family transcriptional regulator [Nanchangia anserum]|uniref:MarR family transcriptional regulator n=1 Tax=Nanchangia anserum TaxID=2692125 RepID=A0A8I0G954_9ACTO|nr:MarR family transcriptional regulator [Nanchangia anserum]MBD3689444.1 MarR family transcriptional regulator [Nanchangia anserum]QOX81644.1 MarR family transcriptional regulator [Nanchangia anserum]
MGAEQDQPRERIEPVIFARTRAQAEESAKRLRAWRTYVEASALLERSCEHIMHEAAGIHRADFQILLTLSEAPAGQMRLCDLASATVVSRPRLTYRLQHLSKRGLLERIPDGNDRRGALARLTPTGYRVLATARAAERESVESLFVAHMAPGDADVLMRVFGDVSAALRERPLP